DGVDVPGLVDGDVHELVRVADRRIGVDVDGVVGEGGASVGRDRHVDAVVVAGSGDDAELRGARRLCRRGDRGVRLVDDVRARVDREVPDRVLTDLEGVIRVDRARELEERRPRVLRAADGDSL